MLNPLRPRLAAFAFAGLFVASLATAAETAAAAPAAARTYDVDPVHSTVGFTVRHLVSKVSGNFRDFSGSITVDPKNVAAATGEFVAKAESIDTANEKRDAHLQSEDFFYVKQYPEIRLRLTKVTMTGADTAKATGDFTMHGVTKPVEFDVRDIAFIDMGESAVMGFTASATVNREDFGITWNKKLDAGGVVLGKDVTINLAVEARAKAAEAAGQ